MKAKKKYEFEPDYRVPPGWTLKEYLEECNISKEVFAESININLDTLENIFIGKQVLTEDLTVKLGSHTRIPSLFWQKLEENYRKPIKMRV